MSWEGYGSLRIVHQTIQEDDIAGRVCVVKVGRVVEPRDDQGSRCH